MAEADCGLCRMAGYRSCDVCGGPVFPPFRTNAFGSRVDLCGYCS